MAPLKLDYDFGIRIALAIGVLVLCLSCAHQSVDSHRSPAVASSIDQNLIKQVQTRVKQNEDLYLNCKDGPGVESCEYKWLKEIVQIFRPSGKEYYIREHILSVMSLANQHLWSNSLKVIEPTKELTAEQKALLENDPNHRNYGLENLVIEVPATGKFANGNYATLALQAHTDIIQATRNGLKLDELDKHYMGPMALDENGKFFASVGGMPKVLSEVQAEDRFLQVQDNFSTLGADNGVGVAVALRYMLDKELVHPKLLLIFTVGEEIGDIGAKYFHHPLPARALINLDSLNAGHDRSLIRGSMGLTATRFSGALKAEPVPSNTPTLTVVLTGLRGGHSGNDIGDGEIVESTKNRDATRPRINAIRLMAHLILDFTEKYKSLRVVTASTSGAGGQIANNFTLKLAHDSKVNGDQLEKEISVWLEKRIELASEENGRDSQGKLLRALVFRKGIATESWMLSPATSWRVANAIAYKFPNWILANGPTKGFGEGGRYPPFNTLLSSNFGNLEISAVNASPNTLRWSMAINFRFYDPEKSKQATTTLGKRFRDTVDSEYKYEVLSSYPQWFIDDSNWLVQVAKKSDSHYFMKSKVTRGASEASIFSQDSFHPDGPMDIILVGPDIRDAHSITEKVRIDSIGKLATALIKLVVAVGDAPEFKVR